MGCNCSSQTNLDKSNLSLPSIMSLSINQEMPIQEPPNGIRIQQNPKFDNKFFCSHLPSIEINVSDPIQIEHASLNSTQNQLKTIQNILQVMNGQVDQVIDNKKGDNHSKRKSKSKRIKMEDLEQIF